MFSTARSTTTNSSSPRTPQDTQRKYAESLPFRVVRAPLVTSLPFQTATKVNPDYYPDDRRNFDWTSGYHESPGSYAAIADDRARTPRHFVGSERGDHNRKPMPDFPIFARLPNEQFIYDRSVSEFYSSSDYDDFSGTTITPSSYSLLASDELSFSTPESPDLSSDHSEDYTPPSTPRDSRNQLSIPSMPSMPSMHLSSYPTLFRDLPDVGGYSAPRLIIPETDVPRSFLSGSDGDIDPRRDPAPNPSRPASAAPASPTAAGEQPYAESVISIESEDTVHRVARINAQYNAAASALYGSLQRDPAFRQHSSAPSTIPAVQRLPTPATTPTEAKSFSVFNDGPLSSSPNQILYPDDFSRSNIYRDNALPVRHSSSNGINLSMPVYLPSSHISATTPTSMRSSRNQDHFLPPRKEWDYHVVPPTPGNSPQSPHSSPNEHYGALSHASQERTHGRPLPIPPSFTRRPSTRDGASAPAEATGLQYSREIYEGTSSSPQDGRPRRNGETDQPAARQSSSPVREQPSSSSPPRPYSDEGQKDKSRSSSKHSSSSKDRHRSGSSGDASRAPDSTNSDSPTHGPRFIAPADSRKSTSRPESSSRHTMDDAVSSRQLRSRDNGEHSERRESRSDKHDRYDSSREDKSKSSRHAQDRESHNSRQERSSRSSAPSTNEKPHDQGRKRRDSFTQRAAPSSVLPADIVLSPRLVPIVRVTAPRPDELARSYSRGAQPTTMTSQEAQVIYQRPIRRHTDDDKPISGSGRNNGRDSTTPASGRPPTEPHRRFSDSDAPQPPPQFLPAGTSSRAPPQPRPMRSRAMSTSRTVRWNENLVCPSPSTAPPRRDGWFNRRGDQLWTNDGLYMPCPAGQEFPPDLDNYPEYGEGWMNEKGVRIDMGHRLIPKAPLRPALKQTHAK